jgi:hypothetical protein
MLVLLTRKVFVPKDVMPIISLTPLVQLDALDELN